MRILDTFDGHQLHEFVIPNDISCIAFDHFGECPAMGSKHGAIKVYRVTGSSVFQAQKQHAGAVHRVSLNRNGGSVLSIGEERRTFVCKNSQNSPTIRRR